MKQLTTTTRQITEYFGFKFGLGPFRMAAFEAAVEAAALGPLGADASMDNKAFETSAKESELRALNALFENVEVSEDRAGGLELVASSPLCRLAVHTVSQYHGLVSSSKTAKKKEKKKRVTLVRQCAADRGVRQRGNALPLFVFLRDMR